MNETTTTLITYEAARRLLDSYWSNGPHFYYDREPLFQIIDTARDQAVPDGVDNPFWELIRRMPWVNDSPWRGTTPYGYADGLGLRRDNFTRLYAWSIPTPGDIAWIANLLDGRGVVEVGAGTGYWAWQLTQAGVDVVAYEPNEPADNEYVAVTEPYVTLLRDDASATGKHPDRALFLSWPSYGGAWAEQALAAYRGDLFVYVGESDGGCCADDGFFRLLDAEWQEIGTSPHHASWWGINCNLVAYRRVKGGAA